MTLTWEQVQDWLLSDGVSILAVIVLALLTRWLLHRAIGKVVASVTDRNRRAEEARPQRAYRLRSVRILQQAAGLGDDRQNQRVSTIGSLLRSVVTFVIVLVTLLTIMQIIGLPLGPVLASAGVGGIALGFGAQTLVKDFISGIFMIFEDQYGVGDVIDTGEAIGTVEEVGLRVTKLRDGNGVIWYIRNGEITRIGNRSQGWSVAVVDTPVSYSENAERVIEVLDRVAQELDEDPAWSDRLLDKPKVAGVESITGTAMTIRTVATCAPNQNLAVQRELRERIKAALDEAGIQPPPAPPAIGVSR
ncbi:MAG: mechanosensitive ion channel [Actinomycetales bacterium]|nr:mechanosensitive ion channel family protein [Tetrasphaera sp.]NLW98631.1 mechanosensitive ion channel [Actinomycetales bacterium]